MEKNDEYTKVKCTGINQRRFNFGTISRNLVREGNTSYARLTRWHYARLCHTKHLALFCRHFSGDQPRQQSAPAQLKRNAKSIYD
jgi:hypothetical protein